MKFKKNSPVAHDDALNRLHLFYLPVFQLIVYVNKFIFSGEDFAKLYNCTDYAFFLITLKNSYLLSFLALYFITLIHVTVTFDVFVEACTFRGSLSFLLSHALLVAVLPIS